MYAIMSYCTINIIQDKLHGSAQNDELIALYCSYWRHLMQKHQCVYILQYILIRV